MTNVEILIPEHMLGSDVTINAKKITARVGVGSLFPPSLSYSLAADGIKSGGNVFVKLSRIKAGPNGLQKGSLVFEASDVDLGLIPLGGTSLEGKVTGDASLDLDFSDLSRSLGYASLQLKKFTTPGAAPQGFVIPSIKFGDVKAKLNIKNSNLEFSEFAFGGPGSDLQGQFGGEIRLGQTFMQSYLNMTIRLQISDSFSQSQDAASLVTILNNFDKRSPGKAYSLRWNKSIAGIAQNFLDNPPDALP
jgi:type II secretion system protein N